MRVLDDGRLLLDNNLAENEIRPTVPSRSDARIISSEATMSRFKRCASYSRCLRHDATMT